MCTMIPTCPHHPKGLDLGNRCGTGPDEEDFCRGVQRGLELAIHLPWAARDQHVSRVERAVRCPKACVAGALVRPEVTGKSRGGFRESAIGSERKCHHHQTTPRPGGQFFRSSSAMERWIVQPQRGQCSRFSADDLGRRTIHGRVAEPAAAHSLGAGTRLRRKQPPNPLQPLPTGST